MTPVFDAVLHRLTLYCSRELPALAVDDCLAPSPLVVVRVRAHSPSMSQEIPAIAEGMLSMGGPPMGSQPGEFLCSPVGALPARYQRRPRVAIVERLTNGVALVIMANAREGE